MCTASRCVRRQGKISISGTSRGVIEWAIRLATRSSSVRGSATPKTRRVLSSTPTRRVPPAVFANADHPVGRGQIALELESLTLGAGEQRERIPWSEIYSEELGKSSLPSNFPAEVRTIAYRSFS